MLWMLLAFFFGAGLLLLIPVRLTVDVHHGARKLMRLRLNAAGIHREWRMEALRTAEGRHLLIAGEDGVPRQMAEKDLHGGPGMMLLKALQHSRHSRSYLLRHVHPEQLDAQLLIHTDNAASTALLTGGAQLLTALLPAAWRTLSRIRVLPDFLRQHSTLQARCIFRARLGTILLTLCMLLAARPAAGTQNAREA